MDIVLAKEMQDRNYRKVRRGVTARLACVRSCKLEGRFVACMRTRVCVCVCVCEREREREKERVTVLYI